MLTVKRWIMEIQGKIIAVLPVQSGISKSTGKPWQSQEYVIETIGQYPRKCCFRILGEDKIKTWSINVGEEITVSLCIDAREYNGRWYNNFIALDVKQKDAVSISPTIANGEISLDDLPFGFDETSTDTDWPF